jgi:hypothetical protein
VEPTISILSELPNPENSKIPLIMINTVAITITAILWFFFIYFASL